MIIKKSLPPIKYKKEPVIKMNNNY